MPEIPPNIQQFIATIAPADRAGFYDWLKVQKSPGHEETRLTVAAMPLVPKPSIGLQPAGITNEDLDASQQWVRTKRGSEKKAEIRTTGLLLLPDKSLPPALDLDVDDIHLSLTAEKVQEVQGLFGQLRQLHIRRNNREVFPREDFNALAESICEALNLPPEIRPAAASAMQQRNKSDVSNTIHVEPNQAVLRTLFQSEPELITVLDTFLQGSDHSAFSPELLQFFQLIRQKAGLPDYEQRLTASIHRNMAADNQFEALILNGQTPLPKLIDAYVNMNRVEVEYWKEVYALHEKPWIFLNRLAAEQEYRLIVQDNGVLSLERIEPAVPQTREQQLEARRQEIARNLAIVAANMEELDDFELVDPGEYSINARPQPSADLYMRLRDQMGRLGSQVSISDGRLMLGSADQATSQMLAEINRRREGRGEPPAETMFDQEQQADAEVAPLTSAIKTPDMIEFSTNLANAIGDLPRVLTSIDTNNPTWGRVNALRHDNITFGKANESAMAASDDLQKRILTTRRIYQDKRYVGRWEQEIEYNRSRREADEGNSKTLGSYRESLIGEDRKIVEEVRVGFDNRGRVYNVDNVHYAEGVQTGITRLHFGYDSDGEITQTIKIELDSSGNNELSREIIKSAPTPERLSAAEAAIGDLLLRGMTLAQALEILDNLTREEQAKRKKANN